MRDQGHVQAGALVVAYAVCEGARREEIVIGRGRVGVLLAGVRPVARARGLDGVYLVVDDHEGLRTTIARTLSSAWQRWLDSNILVPDNRSLSLYCLIGVVSVTLVSGSVRRERLRREKT